MRSTSAALAVFALGLAIPAAAQPAQPDAVVNLYSARHYQTDEALYA
ncbi:MAG: Fe(3+) ABC transporter substrate-binding protein, partial [Polaromonas sp.]|nr:Fe(3+) ABC transporter substrate-binding protein [Polaromonas sp.]